MNAVFAAALLLTTPPQSPGQGLEEIANALAELVHTRRRPDPTGPDPIDRNKQTDEPVALFVTTPDGPVEAARILHGLLLDRIDPATDWTGTEASPAAVASRARSAGSERLLTVRYSEIEGVPRFDAELTQLDRGLWHPLQTTTVLRVASFRLRKATRPPVTQPPGTPFVEVMIRIQGEALALATCPPGNGSHLVFILTRQRLLAFAREGQGLRRLAGLPLPSGSPAAVATRDAFGTLLCRMGAEPDRIELLFGTSDLEGGFLARLDDDLLSMVDTLPAMPVAIVGGRLLSTAERDGTNQFLLNAYATQRFVDLAVHGEQIVGLTPKLVTTAVGPAAPPTFAPRPSGLGITFYIDASGARLITTSPTFGDSDFIDVGAETSKKIAVPAPIIDATQSGTDLLVLTRPSVDATVLHRVGGL